MGTASTMACMVEALGMALPGSAAIPAVHADRMRFAEATGTRAVQMAQAAARCQRDLMTPAAFAMRWRCCTPSAARPTPWSIWPRRRAASAWPIDLDAFDRIGREVPVLLDLSPRGALHGAFPLGRRDARLLHELEDQLTSMLAP